MGSYPNGQLGVTQYNEDTSGTWNDVEKQVKGWLRASMWYKKELGLGAPRAKFGILRTT